MSEARLRVASLEDAAAVSAIYAPYVERTAISFETEPPDAATMAQRIAKVLALHPWLVATVADRDGNDQVVGYAYASPHRDRAAYRWSVDVAAYLDARFHRRGIAKRLYAALCTLLKMQRIVNAFGLISLPNAASAALHESCGFVRCATETRVGYKFDAWHDVGMWQKALQTGAAAPVEPVPFTSLPADAVARVLDS
jgi:L-amino acid N-acyltransferase YncA